MSNYRKATLNDQGGVIDPKKQWYIEYYAMHPVKKKPCRKRDYERFAFLKTTQERYDYAKERITEINAQLAAGWSPFTESLWITTGSTTPSIQQTKYNW